MTVPSDREALGGPTVPQCPGFAQIVRYHRKRARLTQPQLAALSGVGKTVIFDIENGKQTVRLSTLVKVLGALNVRLEWSSPLKKAFEQHAASSSPSEPTEGEP